MVNLRSENSALKKTVYALALVLLLVPTYFIHTKTYPDWGDDFAQYVYQGQQIHSPSEEYKQVLNVAEYSSPKRSVAFSLVLSFIPPTLQIEQYINLISLCYILAGISFFLFLSNHFSLPVSLVATLCAFYNFLFLRLKSEVVPEFFFIALFYGVLYLVFNKSKWVNFVIPVLLGCLFSVRFIGFSLFISYLIFLWMEKGQTLKKKIKSAFTCILIFLAVIAFINTVFLSTVQNREVSLYGNLVLRDYGFHVFLDNVSIYFRYLTLFFEQEILFWMNTIIKCLTMISFGIGFLASIKRKVSIMHLSLIFYFIFLFLYPYNGDTIKYLVPILPLVMYFMIEGVFVVLTKIGLKKEMIVVMCLCIVLFSNSKTIWLAVHHRDRSIGPYHETVLDDFEKIKEKVGLNESIAFGKPFIINLLGDRHSYFLSDKNYNDVFSKANYFLSPKEKISELYPKIKGINVLKGDTTELENFYLIRLIK
ncbi:MAG: hypothetical protein K0S53_1361 [Bacteroidetes bacterium]|nr:hypothetical protein [Bacteroidota bacterium]MDF2450698.1 hypothetical protein [Bacteroidota bacterium]